jgi:IMP dehydrogenase
MGSIEAMKEGSRDRYFQDLVSSDAKIAPEGIEGRVPYKGGAANIIQMMVEGLKAGMGYAGCKTIQELQRKAKFIKITGAGVRESHVHDVIITKEAPNYSLD